MKRAAIGLGLFILLLYIVGRLAPTPTSRDTTTSYNAAPTTTRAEDSAITASAQVNDSIIDAESRTAVHQPRTQINGQSAFVTVRGHLACSDTEELDVAQSLLSDLPALTDYIRAHDCTILRGGDTVVLAPGSGVFTIRFRAPGTAGMLYAANGSIRRVAP